MSQTGSQAPFWKTKTLSQMSNAEWESLCDGCGKCCLMKLEDEDTGEVTATNIACRLLDLDTGRCSNYRHRKAHVPDCARLTPAKTETFSWLPTTCAYRLLAEGDSLPEWHPLITGDPDSVHEAGISVRGWTVSEKDAGPMEHHLTTRVL
ncbi:MAG: YcgN family cysteine cluster protein [Pacificimonas sp.]